MININFIIFTCWHKKRNSLILWVVQKVVYRFTYKAEPLPSHLIWNFKFFIWNWNITFMQNWLLMWVVQKGAYMCPRKCNVSLNFIWNFNFFIKQSLCYMKNKKNHMELEYYFFHDYMSTSMKIPLYYLCCISSKCYCNL